MISEKEFLEQILALADLTHDNNYRDYAHKMLLRIIRCADDGVRECFFPDAGTVNLPYATMRECTELAVRYAAYIISGSNRQAFASKIKTASYQDIGRWFELYAKNVGEDILKQLIDESFELPVDMTVRREFFDRVADMLCKDCFEEVTKLVSVCKSPAPAQMILAVLRNCSYETYGKVRRAWAGSAFFSKTFADYDLLLLLDRFPGLEAYKTADILSKELESAVYQAMTKKRKQVMRWIQSPMGPARFGLLINMQQRRDILKTMAPYISMQMNYGEEHGAIMDGTVNSLALRDNKLLIDNKPVACRSEGNQYVWKSDASEGCVWFYHHGLAAEGYVLQNGAKKAFSAISEDADYRVTYRVGTKTKAFGVKIGTRIHPKTGGSLLYGALYFKGNKIMESYPSSDGVYIDDGAIDNGFLKTDYSEGCLKLKLDLGAVLWSVFGEDMVHDLTDAAFELWRAELALSSDFQMVKGKVWEQTTAGSVTKEGTCYEAAGTYVLPDSAAALSGLLHAPVTDAHAEALKILSESFAEAPKSITELFTLPAPEMKDANMLASDTLYNLMVYYVSDKVFNCKGTKIEWNRLFGRNKDKAREAVVNVDSRILELVEGDTANDDVRAFLERYAKGALANAYSGSSETDIEEALAGARKRLGEGCTLSDLCSFYLQGDGDTSLAEDKGYNIAIEVINRYAYAKCTPGLLKYMDDKGGNWAEKLYEQCLASLPQLKVETISGGSSDISHKTMMLNILDDAKHDNLMTGVDGAAVPMTYGAAIYTKVFNMQLSQMAAALGISFTGDPKHPDFVKMMREIYNTIWVELQKDTSDRFSEEILKAFREERAKFQELSQEEYVQECIDMTIAGMEMVQAGATIVSVIPRLKEFSKRPSATYTGLACSVIFYAISIGSLATVFMKWDKATVAEKVEAILICVQGVCQIGVAAVKIQSMRTLMNPNASVADRMNAAARLNMDSEDLSTIKGLAKVSGQEIDKCSGSCAKELAIAMDEEGFDNVASRFTRFFKVAEYVVRVLTVFLMGLATVMSAVELAKAVSEGGYNASVYLEIISTSLMGLSCVLEGVVLVMDIMEVACGYIPVVGAVCCFVGFVLQIIANAISKPVNPTVEFIYAEINPFLDTLCIPSAEWIEDHKKKNDKKNDRLRAAFA